ncbi:radical SAM protein [Pseudenhygromyxa sp. WMMC2535]|uniref:radical SAM protein n=1 Tax=Pseudenhygromyxa sp. WMMC2535 TaxID=2712867 RepID=UPI0015551448|nr:radical SAM protein [Pseudenhygromyxa sp. WMMC2535]NVB40363.1 radical SAM protein [Pseudenhygromyxa sp. WMMC2535]
MKLSALVPLGLRFVKARATGDGLPLSVIFEVTQRCNLRCKYCSIWADPPPELSLAEIRPLVTEMAAAGVQTVSLVGGEPFLRDDLEDIADAFTRAGIRVAVCTNGSGFAERIAALPGLVFLAISLDGLRPTHDSLRGRGSFDAALDSLRAGVRRGVESLATITITRQNLDVLPEVLALAKAEGFRLNFQPVMNLRYASGRVDALTPSRAELRAFMSEVIAAKQAGAAIFGSVDMLRFIRDNWQPGGGFHQDIGRSDASHVGKVPCHAGRFFCALGSEGTLSPCELLGMPSAALPNVRDAGFEAAFRALPAPRCAGCWCTPYLLRNMATSMRPGAIAQVLRVMMMEGA